MKKTISEKKFKCEVCNQEYSTIEGLTLHNHYSWKHNSKLDSNKTISEAELKQEILKVLNKINGDGCGGLDFDESRTFGVWYTGEDLKVAEKIIALFKKTNSQTKQEPTTIYVVHYSNYEPKEVDSNWRTMEQAEKRVKELNNSMWEISEETICQTKQ